MTQQERDLLLHDLCARLPYGVKCNMGLKYPLLLQRMFVDNIDGILLDFYEDKKDYQVYLSEVKPYLRPMSSMTEEENKQRNELGILVWSNSNGEIGFDGFGNISAEDILKALDWLNAHHFDYRGLIEKGLALEAPKDMYNIK